MPRAIDKGMAQCLCNNCKVEGVIICTATKSVLSKGTPYCNKGDLSMKEAKVRKKGTGRWYLLKYELKGGEMKEIEGYFKITMNVDDIVEMNDDIIAILKRYTKGGTYSLKTLPIGEVK